MASGKVGPFAPVRARQSSMDRPWKAPLAQKLIRPSLTVHHFPFGPRGSTVSGRQTRKGFSPVVACANA